LSEKLKFPLKAKFNLLLFIFLFSFTAIIVICLNAISSLTTQQQKLSIELPLCNKYNQLNTHLHAFSTYAESALITGEAALIIKAEKESQKYMALLSNIKPFGNENSPEYRNAYNTHKSFFEKWLKFVSKTEKNWHKLPPSKISEIKKTTETLIQIEDSLSQFIQSHIDRVSEIIYDDIDRSLKSSQKTSRDLKALGIISLVVIFIVIVWLTRKIIMPISNLNTATHEISKGQLKTSIISPEKIDDEVSSLTHSFVEMVHNLRESTVSKDYFNNIIHSMGSALIVTDCYGNIKSVNQSGLKMLNYTESDLLGKHLSTIVALEKNHIKDLWDQGSESKVIRKDNINYTDSKGKKIPVLFLATMMKTDNEQHVVIEAQDISRIKNIENALRKAMTDANVASKTKSNFLATMSHEIRTPMHGIVGLSEILNETELDSDQKSLLNTIISSSDALLTIINDILDYSKIEAGKMALETIDFNLHNAINDVIKLFDAKKHDDVELISDIAEGTAIIVKGDPIRFKQVLSNLVSNAIKFTKHGSVNIKAHTTDITDQITTIKFEVIDTGIGISKEGTSRLFQSFSQVDMSMTRKYGGTGLGLSICKKICELMGGAINVTSTEYKGSNFHFTLPFIKTTSDRNEQKAVAESESLSANHSDKSLHLLIVEDTKINQKVITSILKKQNYTFDIVENGQEAIDAWQNKHYDLILMDLQMPVMNGIDATKIIREKEDKYKPKTPILAVTANITKETQMQCIKVGMDGFISKPFTKSTILAEIDNILFT